LYCTPQMLTAHIPRRSKSHLWKTCMGRKALTISIVVWKKSDVPNNKYNLKITFDNKIKIYILKSSKNSLFWNFSYHKNKASCFEKMSQYNESDYFSFLMEPNPMKYIGLLISTACIFVGPILIYGIIWYEKYGSNNHRTFLNMIVSMYCLSALVFIFFVQVPETLRGFIGPLPTYVCSSQVNTKKCFYFWTHDGKINSGIWKSGFSIQF